MQNKVFAYLFVSEENTLLTAWNTQDH